MSFLVILILPVLATSLSIAFNLNFLASTLLFFLPPSLYLSIKRPVLIKKSLIFSLMMGVTIVFLLDYMAFADSAWFVPNSLWRFLDSTIPIEDGVWAVTWVYFVTIWYESFLQKSKKEQEVSKNIRKLIHILAGLLIAFFAFYFGGKDFLVQRYFYLKFGVFLVVIPLTYFLYRFPKFIFKFMPLTLYFFFFSILIEYVALHNYHWYYGGTHYLGTTTLSGKILPYEEIIFWWTLGAPCLMAWYEFFVDDRK